MRNLSLGRRHLVNAYEVEAGIVDGAALTRDECDVGAWRQTDFTTVVLLL